MDKSVMWFLDHFLKMTIQQYLNLLEKVVKSVNKWGIIVVINEYRLGMPTVVIFVLKYPLAFTLLFN